jgi:hypothetical protein
MRKLCLLLGLAYSASTFALDCQDIYGIWTGNLGKMITAVRLDLHQFDGMDNAGIRFSSAEGDSNEIEMLKGDCKKDADGRVTMVLDSNSYGVVAHAELQLIDAHTLNVATFSYSAGSWGGGAGSGILGK